MIRVERRDGDYIIRREFSYSVSYYSEDYLIREAKLFATQTRFFVNMIAKSANANLIEEGELLYVLEFMDNFEAFILSFELSSVYRFALSDDGEKVQKLLNPQVGVYMYGIRSITSDLNNLEGLVKRLRYLAIVDGRRSIGSVRAHFNSLQREYGIEPLEVVIMVFNGPGEGVYEDLGAYVLRKKGYLVFHQAAVSMLEYLSPGGSRSRNVLWYY